MKNLHIFRRPTHGFKFLPQFAPDLDIYEAQPEMNMRETVKNSPYAKIIMQSEPGLDKYKITLMQRYLDGKFQQNNQCFHQQYTPDLLYRSEK
jgi:hypothetical protein